MIARLPVRSLLFPKKFEKLQTNDTISSIAISTAFQIQTGNAELGTSSGFAVLLAAKKGQIFFKQRTVY